MKKIIGLILAIIIVIGVALGIIIWKKSSSESSISAEEAIAKVREQFDELRALPVYSNKEADCQASWHAKDKNWQVICSRQNYQLAGQNVELNYTYFVVFNNGNVSKLGNYVKEKDLTTGQEQTLGQPRWGTPK
jgi:Zn-dependent metalloprotease